MRGIEMAVFLGASKPPLGTHYPKTENAASSPIARSWGRHMDDILTRSNVSPRMGQIYCDLPPAV